MLSQQRATLLRRLAFIGLAALAGCEGCEAFGGMSCEVDCHEAVQDFCESCEAQGKVAYRCEYEATDWWEDINGVVKTLDRHLVASGCYPTAADALSACEDACNSDQWEGGCITFATAPVDCSGVEQCGPPSGDDEIGDDGGGASPPPTSTPGLGTPSCEEGWFMPDDVVYDRAVGAYRVNRLFLDHILADPRVVQCDTAEITVDAAGQFAFTGVRPGTLVYEAGLRDGDVPISLQGRTIDDLDQTETVYWELHDASEIVIEVERRGHLMTMTYLVD